MVNWTEQYRPETLDGVRGNEAVIDELRGWAKTWDEHREALLLHGPPGIGKTTAAHALAREMGWITVELSGSEHRTATDIERYVGRGAKNHTLERKTSYSRILLNDDTTLGRNQTVERQVIILDEADNLHGDAARGGMAALNRIVQQAGQPIALVANVLYEVPNELRNACETVEFTMQKRSVIASLRHICREEGIGFRLL